MDWGIVYQLTFFIALGLLAIVITIFVFAVSLLGRATESASKEQQDILLKQKEAKGKQLETLQSQLEEAKKTGQLDESKLAQELQDSKEEIASYDAQLRHLQERVILIRRKGAVVCPGAFLAATIILAVTASGLAESQNLIALSLWIISIITLFFGTFRVFKALGAIEEVTITSQEAIEKLPEAVKAALKELEEERKPELELLFLDSQPPFHVKADSQTTLKLALRLRKGDRADDIRVAFFAPQGFSFPGEKLLTQPADHSKCPGFITGGVTFPPITRGLSLAGKKDIKVPSNKGTFEAYYRIHCSGFAGEYEKFDIIVE